MKWMKIIVLSVIVPYLAWSLYSYFDVTKSEYSEDELTRLKEFGEFYKKNAGKYAFRDCLYYRTYTLNGQMEGTGCIQNMTVNKISYYTPRSSPRIIYRGKSIDGKYMCDLDLGIVFEGKDAGDIDCTITRFKTSEINKFKLGKADVYARKLKEAKK